MSPSHVADSFGARIPIRIALVLACLLAAGCADPPAVKRFAAASSAAGEKFPEISKDIKESCARREEYRLVGRWDADLDSLERVTAGTCAPYGRTVSRLNKSHAVLMEYMKALGSLSAGELVNYDKPVGDLGDALGDIAPDEATRIAAAEGVSSVIAEAVAGKWRRKELGKAIEDANADALVGRQWRDRRRAKCRKRGRGRCGTSQGEGCRSAHLEAGNQDLLGRL